MNWKPGLFCTAFILALTPLGGAYGAQTICSSSAATLNSDYPTGRISKCIVETEDSFIVEIHPEDAPPINQSAWYSFRISGHEVPVTVTLKYVDGRHRYWPKISYDAKNWHRLDPAAFEQVAEDEVKLTFEPTAQPTLVAAQEILTNADYEALLDEYAFIPGFEKSIIGHSVEGRPIFKLETPAANAVPNGDDKPYVFLVGRQHPPELTGAFAMLAFMEVVLGDSPLAKEFRDTFNMIIVPNLNPDGVVGGHWRHNTRGQDLNRDWGPFKHAETQAIKRELDRFSDAERETGSSMWLLLDFHSTSRNLVYTQRDEDETFMKGITYALMTNMAARLDNYEFTREPGHNAELPTSKTYAYERFGIPAMTYEVGDETNRTALADAARVFAEEVMKELLARYRSGIKAPFDRQ